MAPREPRGGKPLTQAELMQWAVLNTATRGEDTTVDRAPGELQKIDPVWIDLLLGKGDAVRMRELAEIIAGSGSVDERIAAFDELELLVESIDNANDLRPLRLWEPIINVLRNDSEPRLRAFAAWVLGTSIQNNPRAQTDFLEENGLTATVVALENDSSEDVLAKCLYCLAGFSRHNAQGIVKLQELRAFDIVRARLVSADSYTFKAKAVWFFRSLFLTAAELADGEHRDGVLRTCEALLSGGIERTADDVEAAIDGDKDGAEDLKEKIGLFRTGISEYRALRA